MTIDVPVVVREIGVERAQPRRRLAAIVAGDVAGYSRLMGEYESQTHAAYKAHIDEVFGPAAAERAGRIIKTTGDGFLAEFASAVQAVDFAIHAQRQIHERNRDVSPQQRLQFRIGINVGDILVEPDDIYGDGVNIAVRLESIAKPGGVCVSANVFEAVKSKLPFHFESRGERRLKNIREPIVVYDVTVDRRPGARFLGLTRASSIVRRRWTYGVAAVIVLALAGGIALWPGLRLDGWLSSPEQRVAARKKRSIAVLAFRNNSPPGAREDYLSDGVSEDIITRLSRIPELVVIARHSSFLFKNRPEKVQQIGEELGAQYLVDGSLVRDGKQIRVSVQLIETSSGVIRWAADYKGQIDNIFTIQDSISSRIVAALALELSESVSRTLASRETNDVDAYDSFLRGWDRFHLQKEKDLREAARLFERAIKLDPNYMKAHAAIAATYSKSADIGSFGFLGFQSAGEARRRAREIIDRLKASAPEPPALAYTVSAALYNRTPGPKIVRSRAMQRALRDAKQAIELDPNSADAHSELGMTLVWSGKPGEAVESLRKAMELNPLYPPSYAGRLGIAKFSMGEFEAAATLLRQSFERDPRSYRPLVYLAAAQALLGRTDEAAKTIVRINEIRARSGLPPYDVSTAANYNPYLHEADVARLVNGLRKAGLPEQPGEARSD